MIDNWPENVQVTVDSGTPIKMILGNIRKQDEQALRKNPVSSVLHVFCVSSCMQVPALSLFCDFFQSIEYDLRVIR